MSDFIQLVGMSGSLRKGSYNTMLLNAAAQLLPTDVSMDIVSIEDIPLYNADLDLPAAKQRPESVEHFRKMLTDADGILISSPEYNYSIPGGLKNAIDWASRPYGDSAWNGKPAAIMGASPGAMGTARAQYHLRQMLVFLNMFPINQPEVMIAHAEERFDQEGNLTDVITKEFILALLQNLVEWTRRIGTSPPQSRVKDV